MSTPTTLFRDDAYILCETISLIRKAGCVFGCVLTLSIPNDKISDVCALIDDRKMEKRNLNAI